MTVVQMTDEEEDDAAQRILPRVREHTCAQTAAEMREDAEECAIQHDEQHPARAFITVRETEKHRSNRYAQPYAPCEAGELLLQLSAEDHFFADARRDAEHDPDRQLAERRWRHLRYHAADIFRMKMDASQQQTGGA